MYVLFHFIYERKNNLLFLSLKTYISVFDRSMRVYMYNRSFMIIKQNTNLSTYSYLIIRINVVLGVFLVCFLFCFLDCTMASFTANDVLLDIEKLETMLTNNSNSSDSMSLHFSPVESRLTTMNMRFTGSSKVYLRNLNKLLSDIETKQKVLTTNSSSMLKRLQPTTSNARSLTFSSLFTRPTVKVSLNHRQEPKNISFGQLISSKLNLPTIYANHQSQYGCAKLNEKMWIVHSREQLIKAVEEESQSQSSHIDDEVRSISL